MRRAFTLIELLVVITIIAVLVGLMIPALGYARLLARSTLTSQRCEDVQRALAQLASDDQTAAQILHDRLAASGLPGVVEFKRDAYWGELFPRRGTWIAAPYPAWCFAHPWGKTPTDLPGDAPTALPAGPVPVEAKALSELTPAFTVPLLMAAGLIEAGDAVAAYRSNRDPKRAWNDAWGRPLVIGLGLYQARQNTAIALGEREAQSGEDKIVQRVRQDLFLKRAQTTYGFTRAFFVAVGSIGTQPEAPLTLAGLADPAADWDTPGSGQLSELWRQIDALCNRDPAGVELWTSATGRDPFADPPWSGVRRGKQRGRYAFLSAPQELR